MPAAKTPQRCPQGAKDEEKRVTDASMVCLYFGNAEECQNCGGWTRAEGGPFPGDPRYCSEDCFADAQERAAQREKRLACCPECGYDCGEHGPACTANSENRKGNE
jgi:hypothetical protein